MANIRITDKQTVTPTASDFILINQAGSDKNTTLARVKTLLNGSVALETVEQNTNAAINEVNTKATNASTDINGIKSTIGTGNIETTSQNLIGAVNEINTAVGKETLETTAQNCTGGINELNKKIGNIDVEKEGTVAAQLNQNTQNINGLKSVVKYGDNETTKILASVLGVSFKDLSNTNFLEIFTSGVNFKDNNVKIVRIDDKLQIKSISELRLLTDYISGVIISNTAGTAYAPVAASAFNVGSKEEFKTNIEEVNADLNLLKNSKIYEYNLKNELEQGIEEKHYGFVIDRETPKEILSPNGDTVDIYSLVSLLWRQNQELLERITILENSVMELGNLINEGEVK